MSSMILRVAARWLTPVMGLIGLYLLVRGHGAPGGGFIGASVLALAGVFRFYAFGSRFVGARGRLGAGSLMGLGLLLSVGVGAAGWLWGDRFFAPASFHVPVPLAGDLKLSSALLFEIGVFLTVVAIAGAVLQELGREEQP